MNTVVVRGNGKLYGYNTDYVGVLRTLANAASRCESSRVLILGAGGAARAVAFALAQAGASVCVWARRIEKAKALARAAGGQAIDAEASARRILRRDRERHARRNASHMSSESPLDAQRIELPAGI